MCQSGTRRTSRTDCQASRRGPCLDAPGEPLAPSVADADIGLDVRAALSGLSTKQRAVMVLRYYEDLTEAQIAEALGCSRGSVKKHAARAIAALSDRLDEHNPDRSGKESR